MRITKGHFSDGEAFEIHDDWNEPGNCHKLLRKPWRGTTTFTDESEEVMMDAENDKVEVGLEKKLDKMVGEVTVPMRDAKGRSFWDECPEWPPR